MIIFGWRRRVHDLGGKYALLCAHCDNQVEARLIKVGTWFTLFFIPVFPYRINYFLRCPKCGKATRVKKNQLAALQPPAAPAEESLEKAA